MLLLILQKWKYIPSEGAAVHCWLSESSNNRTSSNNIEDVHIVKEKLPEMQSTSVTALHSMGHLALEH